MKQLRIEEYGLAVETMAMLKLDLSAFYLPSSIGSLCACAMSLSKHRASHDSGTRYQWRVGLNFS